MNKVYPVAPVRVHLGDGFVEVYHEASYRFVTCPHVVRPLHLVTSKHQQTSYAPHPKNLLKTLATH